MRLYKLTDSKGQTRNNTQWGEGVTHTASGQGDLCEDGWIHAYTDPLLAVLLNPIHANFQDPQLWEAEGEVEKEDRGLKVGVTVLRTIRRLPIPEISIEQKVRFAIFCALAVYQAPAFVTWATAWVSGEDRSVAMEWSVARVMARAAASAAAAAMAAAVATAVAAAVAAAQAAKWAVTVKPLDLAALAAQAMEGEPS